MRIAILGAGGVGVCAALELANRGYRVDVFDEHAEPLCGASRNNEGKVHVGLVYAKDPSLETARTMILGAIHFAPCLNRWIDLDPIDHLASSPFYYAVHKDTMTSPDALAAHYHRCQKLFEEACSSTGLAYMGRDRRLQVEQVSAQEMGSLVSPQYFDAVFRTSEVAIDARAVADRLRAAMLANPCVRFIGGAQVVGAAWSGASRTEISFRLDGSDHTETYDQVANTLWQGRLAIDSALGLEPERTWIYRYKLGGRINVPARMKSIPSLTMVLGPFGDVVNFGCNGVYFSWYPEGMIGASHELRPPEWGHELAAADCHRILRKSYEDLSKRCPAMSSLGYCERDVEPVGGVIFAWGSTGIESHHSHLHTRHEIGIHTVGSYHSANTGKYTMVPYFGYQMAERILGGSRG